MTTRLCLSPAANPNVCSTPTTNEVTPLHVAAGLGHLACLQLLVQSGGDILWADNRNQSPLDYARANGQDLCFNYLQEQLGQGSRFRVQGVWPVIVDLFCFVF